MPRESTWIHWYHVSTCEAARIRSPGLLCGSISGELRGIRVEDQIRQIGAGQFPQVLGVDGALKNAGVYWCIYVMFYVRVCIFYAAHALTKR